MKVEGGVLRRHVDQVIARTETSKMSLGEIATNYPRMRSPSVEIGEAEESSTVHERQESTGEEETYPEREPVPEIPQSSSQRGEQPRAEETVPPVVEVRTSSRIKAKPAWMKDYC